MQLGTEVHTPHPNISLTRSQVGAQPMRDGVGSSSHGPHGYYVNYRTIPYKIELGVVR